jgi:predicted ester cyclase
MTAEENKKLILDHYESFVHQQDAEAVRKQLAADFRDHEMPPGTPPGPGAALQYRAMLHKAFPDLRFKIEDIIAEGDRVAVRASWTGTHRGLLPIMPVPVTNRAFASREWCSGASATARLRSTLCSSAQDHASAATQPKLLF